MAGLWRGMMVRGGRRGDGTLARKGGDGTRADEKGWRRKKAGEEDWRGMLARKAGEDGW